MSGYTGNYLGGYTGAYLGGLAVAPAPPLVVAPTAVPTPTGAVLYANATGGTGTLGYAWTGSAGLTFSSATAEQPTVTGTTGTHTASVTVTDAVGVTASGLVGVEVAGATLNSADVALIVAGLAEYGVAKASDLSVTVYASPVTIVNPNRGDASASTAETGTVS